MEDNEVIGGGSTETVDPESFFTGDEEQENQSEVARDETNQQGSEPIQSEFNPDEWKFKAAGKEYIPQSREELIKLASLGVNYDVKARKLNEDRAKFLEEKAAFEQGKTATQQPTKQEEQPLISQNPFMDPDVANLMEQFKAMSQELASIKEAATSASQVTSEMTQQQYDTWLDDSITDLRNELGETFNEEAEQELCLDLQEMMDSVPDERLKTKEGVANFVRSVFFIKHPEGIDAVVQNRVKNGVSNFKQNNGKRVITEGNSLGSAKRNDVPVTWDEADERAQALFANLKPEDFK